MRWLLILMAFITMGFTPKCNEAGVKRVWLFSKTLHAGIVRTDESGVKSKGITHSHFLIIETDIDNNIVIDSVIYANKSYEFGSSVIKSGLFSSVEKNTNKVVAVKAKSERKLLELQVFNIDQEFADNADYQFVVYGNTNGKPFKYLVDKKNVNLKPELYQ